MSKPIRHNSIRQDLHSTFTTRPYQKKRSISNRHLAFKDSSDGVQENFLTDIAQRQREGRGDHVAKRYHPTPPKAFFKVNPVPYPSDLHLSPKPKGRNRGSRLLPSPSQLRRPKDNEQLSLTSSPRVKVNLLDRIIIDHMKQEFVSLYVKQRNKYQDLFERHGKQIHIDDQEFKMFLAKLVNY